MTTSECNRVHADDPSGYVKYYCEDCTALKRQGTTYCPFCGIPRHYHVDPISGAKVKGAGRVSIHLHTLLNEASEPRTVETASSVFSREKVSDEDDQFERSIKTIRGKYDNLKRARRQRDSAEAQIATERQNIIALEKAVGNLQATLQSKDERIARDEQLTRDLIGQIADLKNEAITLKANAREATVMVESLSRQLRSAKRPAPIAIGTVCGQKEESDVLEALSILEVSQGGNFCNITVRLPR